MPLSHSRDQVKATVKDAADIVQVIGEHVELKRAGARFSGRCPFHNEKTPSFSVNPQGQFYHCFGCGEHGDVFSFVMKFHHMDFPDALKMLAQKFGVDLPERKLSESEQAHLRQRDSLYQANEEAVLVYQQCLRHPKLGQNARNYLEQRGVPQEFVERYRLGYAPDTEQGGWSYLFDQLTTKGLKTEVLEQVGLAVRKDRGGHYDRFRSRILFPITDMTGRVVAFGGRILGEGQPKYMNSPESPIFEKSRLLFGLYQHRQAIRQARRALVVEGNFDLLSLVVHGIENVVAPLGTALTRAHIHSLRSYGDEVVLLFDADAAGLKAAMRSIPFMLAERVEGRVALLPVGHDPDSFVREQGAEAVEALVTSARPLAEFAFDTLVREHSLTLTGKNRIVGELQQLLAESADPEQRELMIAHFSEKLGVSAGYFRGKSVAISPRPQAEVKQQAVVCKEMATRDKQLVDFLVLHPEFFHELQAAGMKQVVTHPLALDIIAHIDGYAQRGSFQPEDLLVGIGNMGVQNYIVELLTAFPPLIEEDDSKPGERMVDELLNWLRSERQRRDGAGLQRQIAEAEQRGDIALLMELLREKQTLERKRQSF
ncbi:MAG: DNA primase [Desulfobulbus sp.]|nr:DNA primase [Desulfobulbus sp.]